MSRRRAQAPVEPLPRAVETVRFANRQAAIEEAPAPVGPETVTERVLKPEAIPEATTGDSAREDIKPSASL